MGGIMGFLKHIFSEQEIANLMNYRDKQSDGRLKLRFIALLMLNEGFEYEQTSLLIGKSAKTIENWLIQYKNKGIDSLNSFQYRPKKTFLTNEQISSLTKWVRETNPGKTKEVRMYIKDNFKVSYSIEGVRQLLKKHGLKILRPKVIPGKPPSEDDQKKTVERYFEMKASAEPGTIFLFGDGMHLVHQNIPALCWGDPKKPPILKTLSLKPFIENTCCNDGGISTKDYFNKREPNITIYDNFAASGSVIGVITTTSNCIGEWEYNVPFSNGLTVVTAGTPNITLVYE